MTLTRIRVPDLNEGLSFNDSNITSTWTLDEETINASMGVYAGLGPRYGMGPLPYQNIQTEAFRNAFGLGGAESASSNELFSRLETFGIYGISVRKVDTNLNLQPDSAVHYYTVNLQTNNENQPRTPYRLVYSTITNSSGVRIPTINGIAHERGWLYSPTGILGSLTSVFKNQELDRFFEKRRLRFAKSAVYTNPAVSIATPWVFFENSKLKAPTSLQSPNGTLGSRAGTMLWIETGDFSKEIRTFAVFTSNLTRNIARYSYKDYNFSSNQTYFPNKSLHNSALIENFKPVGNADNGILNPAGGLTFATVPEYIVVHDDKLTTNTAFTAIFTAYDGAKASIIFDWMYGDDSDGFYVKNDMIMFDLAKGLFVPQKDTLDALGGSTAYLENGQKKTTAWNAWPTFNEGTALNNSPIAPDFATRRFISLGAADSGILRKNTTYEFTYSIFDKLTGFEGNVGVPAKIRTGTNDNVAITLAQNVYVVGVNYNWHMRGQQSFSATVRLPIDFFYTDISGYDRINHMEYRIYYRALGTLEWLPALFIDAVKYFYSTDYEEIWMCKAAIPGLPGPRPGGFQDASSLPQDNYFDVVNYRNYTFWCSPKSLNYSGRNQPFSYPIANAVPCPRGQFRGMISHAFPGQAQQDSRLVIFGSEETYIGRFRGPGFGQLMSIRVSPDTLGNFERPGSDFIVDTWTSITSFSSRAAVVAEGILYYWGESGIYRDVGNELPTKDFSQHMEPWLNTVYDKTRITDTHSVYNSKTKEILWFFSPANTTVHTQMCLVYNLRHDAFYWFGFGLDITVLWSQITDIAVTGSNSSASGPRILLGIKNGAESTPTRVVTFDELNKSGDFQVTAQYMCKQVALNGFGTGYLLNFVGNPGIILNAGDTITISNFNWHTQRSEQVDGIYSVLPTAGSTQITVFTHPTLPALPIFTPDVGYEFPVYVSSKNGFPFAIRSDYWEPAGEEMYAAWRYMHHRYTVNLYKSPVPQTLNFRFYTLQGTDYAEQTCTLIDNAKGNCIRYSQIPITKLNTEGGALSLRISTPNGTWNGGVFYLQMLAFDLSVKPGGNNKIWEG